VFRIENFIMIAGIITIALMAFGCSVKASVDTSAPVVKEQYEEGLYEGK
jgi:hypothetical protein